MFKSSKAEEALPFGESFAPNQRTETSQRVKLCDSQIQPFLCGNRIRFKNLGLGCPTSLGGGGVDP